MMADDLDYLADFHAPFHDLRGAKEHADCLAADDYTASQALAAQLLKQGSAGIVYPQRAAGTRHLHRLLPSGAGYKRAPRGYIHVHLSGGGTAAKDSARLA
jgi:RES domain-containing protein